MKNSQKNCQHTTNMQCFVWNGIIGPHLKNHEGGKVSVNIDLNMTNMWLQLVYIGAEALTVDALKGHVKKLFQ